MPGHALIRSINAASRQHAVREQATMLKRELEQHLGSYERTIRNRYQSFTRGWSLRPRFAVTVQVTGGRIVLWAGPDATGAPGERPSAEWVFHFVDKGTQPHEIRARRAPYLRFRTGYSARTAPVARGGVGTGQATGPWVMAKAVQHPGTEAREFSREIIRILRPGFRRECENAIRRAIRRTRRR